MSTRPRIDREARTLQAMFAIYCRKKHNNQSELCSSCQELAEYSFNRLDRCPFQEGKTTCANCPIHCYKPAMREQIRDVMRFSGPRMMLDHPILTIRHFLDDRRKEPLITISPAEN
ncbi:MAG TPA: nitrous oxide-stimulated promoter family protein [Anaerolineales bacterium]|nr:nitrous oxide-stimulated promoter family protein [Anaerolineales bacterium]